MKRSSRWILAHADPGDMVAPPDQTRSPMNRSSLSLWMCFVALVAACDEKKADAPPPVATTVAAPVSPPQATTPSASATPSAKPSASAPAAAASAAEVPLASGAKRFALVTGKGTFLIDAPLEKIKGMSDEVAGRLDVNARELGKSTGEIMVRVSTLKTSTFANMDKDVAQTEHARNWMEVGNDSPAASRMKYEWATFTVTSVDPAVASLADAKEEAGGRSVKAKVSGDFTLHGVTSQKTVAVTLQFKGPPEAPAEVDFRTDGAMPVSMKEHSVKPRDTVGSLLNGALERIGKKIDDKVQVSFEVVAKATMPAGP